LQEKGIDFSLLNSFFLSVNSGRNLLRTGR